MHRRQDVLGEVGVDLLAAFARDAELGAEERLSGCGAEADQDTRLDGLELAVQPDSAGGDLRRVRLLVDAALAARDPLEVLDGVRDVDRAAVDPRVLERLVEKLPGGPYERLAQFVLLVTGLLAD